jgi:glutamine phosphoribosylpyrophosphate amidotransferase
LTNANGRNASAGTTTFVCSLWNKKGTALIAKNLSTEATMMSPAKHVKMNNIACTIDPASNVVNFLHVVVVDDDDVYEKTTMVTIGVVFGVAVE